VWGRRCCRQQLVAEPAGEPEAKPTHLPEQADARNAKREGRDVKRSLLVLGMVLALALTSMANAEPDYPDPAITSPAAGEVIYENTLNLAGVDSDAQDNNVQWAVRSETCAIATGTVAGNVDGFDDDFAWEGGYFTATLLDISGLDAGEYCFVLNTTQGEAAGSRLTQEFYIVDEYAKVGGNVDNADYLINTFENDLKELRGRQLSHAFEGVVGNAGSAGTVGSITVNYRQLDEYKVFVGDSLSLSAAGGIDVTDPTARAAVMTVNSSQIILLDKDASPDFERGAAIVRYEGDPSDSKYEIDANPGETGADSWVPLVNGNVEVGTR